jgi:hypothetical protein
MVAKSFFEHSGSPSSIKLRSMGIGDDRVVLSGILTQEDAYFLAMTLSRNSCWEQTFGIEWAADGSWDL